MRIISGTHKGRRIDLPRTYGARPTTDFAKEALFNILALHFDWNEAEALDLFAGSGSIGYEFASRGCRQVDCVDNEGRHCAFIARTAQAMGLAGIRTHCRDAFWYVSHCRQRYSIIFADPPYTLAEADRIPDIVFGQALLKADGWLIVEHGGTRNFETHPHFLERRRYGSVNFSIFASSSLPKDIMHKRSRT